MEIITNHCPRLGGAGSGLIGSVVENKPRMVGETHTWSGFGLQILALISAPPLYLEYVLTGERFDCFRSAAVQSLLVFVNCGSGVVDF